MDEVRHTPIQTRSERYGLTLHETLKDAFRAAQQDNTIWKISFNSETGERIRLIRMTDADGAGWLYQPLMEFS